MQRGHGEAERLLVGGFDGVEGLDTDFIDRVVASGGKEEDSASDHLEIASRHRRFIAACCDAVGARRRREEVLPKSE